MFCFVFNALPIMVDYFYLCVEISRAQLNVSGSRVGGGGGVGGGGVTTSCFYIIVIMLSKIIRS